MTDTNGVHPSQSNRAHCTPTGLREFMGYVSLKSEQLKVVVGITDGRLFCFCSATSRVREEPVLCVFACSV